MGKQPRLVKSEMKNLKHTTVSYNYTTEMQRIRRDYYNQLFTDKMDNLGEPDKLGERNSLPRESQEETKNTNAPITSTEIESVI